MNTLSNPASQPLQNPPGNPFVQDTPAAIKEEDKVITVKMKGDTMIDGTLHRVGTTHKITVQRWRSLSRLFEWVDGPTEHHPETYHAPTGPTHH